MTAKPPPTPTRQPCQATSAGQEPNRKEFEMNRRLIPAILVTGLVMTAGAVAGAHAAPPTDASGGGKLVNFCTFDVNYTLTGKTKTITKPDGQRIITSPGQKITLFTDTKTVSYVITGTRFERDTTVNGETITEIEVTGRNILLNEIGKTQIPGLFLVVGNFNYSLRPGFVEDRPFDPNGPGQVTDICEALS
jgi:hypothetical protein